MKIYHFGIARHCMQIIKCIAITHTAYSILSQAKNNFMKHTIYKRQMHIPNTEQ